MRERITALVAWIAAHGPRIGWKRIGDEHVFDDIAVVWPTTDPLWAEARFRPQALIDHLLQGVVAQCAQPLPPEQRSARSTALERELESLRYEEEALLLLAIERGERVRRHPLAPVQAILQVQVNAGDGQWAA
jgi:hypothetical protein